ncbi:MAG: hypothetical protein WBB45_19940 [Cyclobacteriaceae bacterium]
MKRQYLDMLRPYGLQHRQTAALCGGTGDGGTGNGGSGTGETEDPPPMWYDPDDTSSSRMAYPSN